MQTFILNIITSHGLSFGSKTLTMIINNNNVEKIKIEIQKKKVTIHMCQTNEHINLTIFFVYTYLTIVIKQLHHKL
jgi:hypothetical protein